MNVRSLDNKRIAARIRETSVMVRDRIAFERRQIASVHPGETIRQALETAILKAEEDTEIMEEGARRLEAMDSPRPISFPNGGSK